MRELTGHKVNEVNDLLRIFVTDLPNVTGANHDYEVQGPLSMDRQAGSLRLQFQNGPINEVGVNGITHEALLAILIDRLQCFQDGPYKCRENALALTKLEEAQMWLLQRTRNRMMRGVEGTHKI